MATNHTENYNLNLWEPTDKFVREEFNENTNKIDAALGALSATMPGKLGRMEIIDSWKSGGTMNSSVSYGLSKIDWSDWEYVCFLSHYPDMTANDTNPLSFSLLFQESETFTSETVTPLALPGYLAVLLPRHNGNSKAAGFILSDRFVPFSCEGAFKSIVQFSFATKDHAERLIAPNAVIFGGK